MEQKMASGILGFAIGDALGVPIEFLNREILEKHPLSEMIGYGSHSVPEGTWSDDTSLMLATIDSIVECGYINYSDMMSKFTQWYDYAKYTATDVMFDIGISTRKAIIKYKNNISAIECGGRDIMDNGNGSLMRILPIVYYLAMNNFSDEEEVEIIKNCSSLTHGHEISCLGCKIFSDYTKLLLNNYDKLDALNQIKMYNYSKYYSLEAIQKYNRILIDDLSSVKKDKIKSSGFIVDTLEASIWCTLNSNSYEEAIVKAINLGEDTDTIGAIAGALNGIIYGEEQIPIRWTQKLRKKDYLLNLYSKFYEVLNSNKKFRRI